MIYVGMDVSSKSFVMHAIDDKKKLIWKGEIESSRRGLRGFRIALQKMKRHVLFVFEAGNQMKWIAETIKKMPDTSLHVVHPNEIKWIAESSGKTDAVDARKMAELARMDALPRKVHVVEGNSRQMRELASAREMLQSKRISIINFIRGICLQEGHKLPVKFFARSDWKEQLKKSKFSVLTKKIIEANMVAIDGLLDAEAEITGELCTIKDEKIDLIESIPAIGKISSRVLIAGIDKVERFDNKKSIARYGALTPRIYQSGNVRQLGRIVSSGRCEIRKVLLQCAHTITRMKAESAAPLKAFYLRVERRSGKKKAIVALSRKLLTTVYGVLKSNRPYDPRMLMTDRKRAA